MKLFYSDSCTETFQEVGFLSFRGVVREGRGVRWWDRGIGGVSSFVATPGVGTVGIWVCVVAVGVVGIRVDEDLGFRWSSREGDEGQEGAEDNTEMKNW